MSYSAPPSWLSTHPQEQFFLTSINCAVNLHRHVNTPNAVRWQIQCRRRRRVRFIFFQERRDAELESNCPVLCTIHQWSKLYTALLLSPLWWGNPHTMSTSSPITSLQRCSSTSMWTQDGLGAHWHLQISPRLTRWMAKLTSPPKKKLPAHETRPHLHRLDCGCVCSRLGARTQSSTPLLGGSSFSRSWCDSLCRAQTAAAPAAAGGRGLLTAPRTQTQEHYTWLPLQRMWNLGVLVLVFFPLSSAWGVLSKPWWAALEVSVQSRGWIGTDI